MREENNASKPIFDVIMDLYFQLLAAGFEPAKAKRVMNLYLEDL